MPSLTVELTIDDLLGAVSKLDQDELAEFETRLDQLRFSRSAGLDREAAQIAAAQKLPAHQQARVRELLQKNREEGLTAAETAEIDSYLAKLDQSLENTADELLKLAEERRQYDSSGTQ